MKNEGFSRIMMQKMNMYFTKKLLMIHSFIFSSPNSIFVLGKRNHAILTSWLSNTFEMNFINQIFSLKLQPFEIKFPCISTYNFSGYVQFRKLWTSGPKKLWRWNFVEKSYEIKTFLILLKLSKIVSHDIRRIFWKFMKSRKPFYFIRLFFPQTLSVTIFWVRWPEVSYIVL